MPTGCSVSWASNEDIRQLGINFILIDMKSPGITVKQGVTLDKPAGLQEINMVYLEACGGAKRKSRRGTG